MKQKKIDLSAEKIKKYLSDDFNIKVFQTITSTNTVLKEMAKKSAPQWSVIISEEQTAGRGRHGRTFYSPKSDGLYMSFLVRPEFSVDEAAYVTPAAAVSVCTALSELGCESPKIKWVNDIFCGTKKVCGILSEVGFNKENSALDFIVIGIGINISTDIFPSELENIATSAFDKKNIDRNLLAALILKNFRNLYDNFDKKDFVELYKHLSFLPGMNVNLVTPVSSRKAFILGIDDTCRLVAKFEDGSIEHISTGEVSVRF